MGKIVLILITFFLISCGLTNRDGSYKHMVTYNVPQKYYDTYQSDLKLIESEIVSKTGKQLVRFVGNPNDPKFETLEDAYKNFRRTGEAWVYFKNSKDVFVDQGDDAAGTAYVGSPSNPTGVILLNFSISMYWGSHNFHQVVAHEVLHCLGYDHTFGEDYSIMNYNYVYAVYGITSLDSERLSSNFPFALVTVTVKDLEKYAAVKEEKESEKYAEDLMENYGLSEKRAQVISKHLVAFRKIQNQRALTASEKDLFTREILGFGYENGKAALEKYLQGNRDSMDDLIDLAASKNEVSPEHIKELFGEIFLK